MVRIPGQLRARDGHRREEVERCLAALGLGRRFPRRLQAATDQPPIVRLAAALPALGPVFTAFGRYLSTRVDLLPEGDCEVLSTVPDDAPPLPPEPVRDLLLSELGPERVFAAFDPVPSVSTLVYQEHRARVAGAPVVVRLVRPELAAESARDLDLLPLLRPALAAGGAEPRWLGAAVDDFTGMLAVASDLDREAAALIAMGHDGAASGLALSAPRVLRDRSTARVLTVEELPGATLAGFPPPALRHGDGAAEAGFPAGGRWGAEELAMRLCQAWLRQACFGQVFPVDFRDGDVRLLPDRRIAWTGGTFAALPPAAKVNLWEYLLAVAAQDTERACAALTRELEGGPAGGSGPLHQRLRQLVPFRDGGWGARDDLAGYLFLHWRCAAQAGYRPRAHGIAFYRGLARLAAAARRLAPGRDALREGLEAARLTAGMDDVMRLFGREQIKEVMGDYAAALLTLPERVNELLNLAAEGRVTVKVEVVEPPAERRRKDLPALTLAALSAMAAVVLLARHLESAGLFGPWPERVAAALLGLLGAFLFLGARRRP